VFRNAFSQPNNARFCVAGRFSPRLLGVSSVRLQGFEAGVSCPAYVVLEMYQPLIEESAALDLLPVIHSMTSTNHVLVPLFARYGTALGIFRMYGEEGRTKMV
jgi:hypothetical protein